MRIRISLCGGDNWEEEIKGDRILLESSEVESEENKILKTETLSVGEQPTDKGVCVCQWGCFSWMKWKTYHHKMNKKVYLSEEDGVKEDLRVKAWKCKVKGVHGIQRIGPMWYTESDMLSQG